MCLSGKSFGVRWIHRTLPDHRIQERQSGQSGGVRSHDRTRN